MIVSAISLWKKFNVDTPLSPSEWGAHDYDGTYTSHVTYSGHTAKEIARELGKEEKSVQNAIYRIRKKLRATLPTP